MTTSGASPLSSPRLPSPPPIAEDQLGPASPSPEEQQKLFSTLDHGASRRIRPGTKAHDMAEGPPLVDLSEIDSAFQLTEHLKALHNFLTHPVGSGSTIAIDRDMAFKLAHPPENVEKSLWLYELCRFLTQKINSIIIALFADDPPCSSVTCPEMRASEWQYLCAVHDPPKSCCAVDYCCHTLDWAANTLTSQKNFPSRLAMSADHSSQQAQVKSLTTIFRRVYRIFAHAWFQHQEMFWKIEGQTGLYMFFKTVCDVYGLVDAENYTIPPEAEGIEAAEEAGPMRPPLIMKREPSNPGSFSDNTSVIGPGDHSLSTAGTTKRHRLSPSVAAAPVSTVLEESEEEGDTDEDAEEEPAPTSQEAATQAEEAPTSAPVEPTEISADSSSDEDEDEDEDEEEDEDSEDETVFITAEDTDGTGEAEKQTPSTAADADKADKDGPTPETAAEEAQAATETSTLAESAPTEKAGDEEHSNLVTAEAADKSSEVAAEKTEKAKFSAAANPDKDEDKA